MGGVFASAGRFLFGRLRDGVHAPDSDRPLLLLPSAWKEFSMPTPPSWALPVPGIAKAVAHLLEDRSAEFCPCGLLAMGLAAENIGFSVEEVWIALGQLQQTGFLSVVDYVEPGWCRVCVSGDHAT